ncbi:MAG: glycoside hydrolase family 127 protein [Arachnia sp.]
MTAHAASLALPVRPRAGALRPLTLDRVRIAPSFWGTRQATNHNAILSHAHQWMVRLGWVQNFLDAAGKTSYPHHGKEFADSEVYKLIEALSWELYRAPDAGLQAILEELIAAVLPAQAPDGYLHTRFGRPWQPPRYSDFKWGHELYCFGHFIQAAVAHHRTTGSTELLDAATKLADHVCVMFGADGLPHVCGHPEIEMALVELYRVTGEPRYLESARVLIERRGHGTMPLFEFGTEYWQDARPVRESEVLHGHAVRALYFAAGVVDLAVETEDQELLEVLERQWERTVAARTYITGGMGSHHMDEAFGDDFVLPPDRSYCETCAGVASIMLSWRLLLATGRARYADLIERTLYNIVATSPSADGRSFFYANTLHQRQAHGMAAFNEDGVVIRGGSAGRQAWFEVSCCPPNLARMLASLQGYVATTTSDAVQLHQWVPTDVATELADGAVALRVSTDYPETGRLVVEAVEAPDDGINVAVRVPAWARSSEVTVDGRPAEVGESGYLPVHLDAGARVAIELPIRVRVSAPDPRIDAVRGCVAFERGPVVLALESVDLPEEWDVNLIATTGRVMDGPDGPRAEVTQMSARPAEWPYATPTRLALSEARFVPLVNYHEWGERGPSAMRIFVPLA